MGDWGYQSEEVKETPDKKQNGIAFDTEGSLYVSCYAPNRIYQVSKLQEVTVLIDDWEGHTLANPTNIAFGGNDFSTLFVANLGRWHVAALYIQAEGLKLVCHKPFPNPSEGS